MGYCLECNNYVSDECLCPLACAECEKWGKSCDGCFERGEIHSLIIYQISNKLENFEGIDDEIQKVYLEKLRR